MHRRFGSTRGARSGRVTAQQPEPDIPATPPEVPLPGPEAQPELVPEVPVLPDEMPAPYGPEVT